MDPEKFLAIKKENKILFAYLEFKVFPREYPSDSTDPLPIGSYYVHE